MQNLTKRDFHRANRALEAMKSRYRNAMEKSEETMDHVVGGAVAAGSAFGFGVLQGRFAQKGGLGIMGVPIELAAGAAAYVAAALGVGGAASKHIYHLGQGALCAFTTTMGRGVGMKMVAGAGASPARALKGESSGNEAGIHGDASLSPSELESLANPTRV